MATKTIKISYTEGWFVIIYSYTSGNTIAFEPLFSDKLTAALREDPFASYVCWIVGRWAGVLGHFLPRITLISLLFTDIELPGVTFNSRLVIIDQTTRRTLHWTYRRYGWLIQLMAVDVVLLDWIALTTLLQQSINTIKINSCNIKFEQPRWCKSTLSFLSLISTFLVYIYAKVAV